MQISMIGPGRMGTNMVHRLLRGGRRCVVYDTNRDTVTELAKSGGRGEISQTPGRERSGGGHFVKVVHNGIEYGLMQAYAEGLNNLRHANVGKKDQTADAETTPLRNPEHYQYDLNLTDVSEVWRHGSVIASWLLDLTATALCSQHDLSKFSDRVSDSGEGRWTVAAAIDEGAPVPVLTAPLYRRFTSRGEEDFAKTVTLRDAIRFRRSCRENIMTRSSTGADSVLVIDIGGTHIKVLATGKREERDIPSGLKMTARKMVREVKRITKDWEYSHISIGYPGLVIHGRPLREPHNLARGWVGFNFVKAFGCPVKIVNDAAMQALGSYRGGRMLFLGLGAGLGSAMIGDGLESMEGKDKMASPCRRYRETAEGCFGSRICGVGGGGTAREMHKLPAGTRLGHNRNAFVGGFRLWETGVGPQPNGPKAKAAAIKVTAS